MSAVIGATMLGIVNREEWQSRGACRKHKKPDIWFPDKKTPSAQTVEARSVCVGCEVRDQCLQYAMEHPEEPGIWGGLTKAERDGMCNGEKISAFARCDECSTEFVKRHRWHRFCSDECRKTVERRRDFRRHQRHRDLMRIRRAKAKGEQ